MDAALNEFMLIGINIVLRDNPVKTKSGGIMIRSEFEIVGQITLEEFKDLRKTSQTKELSLRCDFGNYIVKLKHLEYNSIKETYSLYVVEKP